MNSVERDQWAVEIEEDFLKGGASFSEWATLMSYEAHTCFVAGADIATIILCASCCEAFLRTETGDHTSRLVELTDRYGFSEELRNDLHQLRVDRNKWAHSSIDRISADPVSYEMAYTPELEGASMFAYRTMLKVLFSNPWV